MLHMSIFHAYSKYQLSSRQHCTHAIPLFVDIARYEMIITVHNLLVNHYACLQRVCPRVLTVLCANDFSRTQNSKQLEDTVLLAELATQIEVL